MMKVGGPGVALPLTPHTIPDSLVGGAQGGTLHAHIIHFVKFQDINRLYLQNNKNKLLITMTGTNYRT